VRKTRSIGNTANNRRERLRWRTLLAYGVGGLGNPIVGGNILQFMNPFYNAVLGVPATLVGLVIFFPRLWDAISDPLIGQWSDNCRSRWGRRKPFLFVGAIGLALSFFLFWNPPFAAGNTVALTIWILVVGLILFTFWTIFFIPYGALGYELSVDYDERTRIMAVRTGMSQIAEAIRGYALVVGLFLIVKTPFAGNQRIAFGVSGFVYAMILLVSGLIVVFCARERFGKAAAVGMSLRKSTLTTLRNPLYVRIILFQIFFNLGLLFLATTIVYLITFYVNDPALFGHTTMCTGLVVLAGLVLWNKLTPHFGKIWVLRVGVLFCMAAAASTYVAYIPGQRWSAFIVSILWGPGWAAYTVMVPAIIADLTDLDELKTGKRREGSYASVYGFVTKLAVTGAAVLVGLVLDFGVGFVPALGVDQAPSTWLRMRLYTVFVPTLLLGLAILSLGRFPLTKKRMLDIRAQLDARKVEDRARGSIACAYEEGCPQDE
jgi:GPH family glycoside/pentoside/hexuronide:cation symporter